MAPDPAVNRTLRNKAAQHRLLLSIRDRMYRFIRFALVSVMVASSATQAEPCPSLYIDPKDADAKAEWIIEGNISEIKKTGTFTSCEHVTRYCTSVDKPELIILQNTTVIRGSVNIGSDGRAKIQRKSHCFSGSLSAMNSKPELKAVGQRMRFFGSASSAPPFIQAGYFWVQPAE
jgi:hypothetical protein